MQKWVEPTFSAYMGLCDPDEECVSMKSEFSLAFNEITERFSLPAETVLETLEAAMASAYRRSVNASSAVIP